MSLQIKALAALVAALIFAGAEWQVYRKGREAGRAEIQLQWDKQVQVAEKAVRVQADAQQKVITQTVTQFVEKAAQERIFYRDIIREVEKNVPNDLPMLPGSFRVLHDAAAAGAKLSESGDPPGVAAAAVAPADVAVTVAENYASCNYDQERLQVLQRIVKDLIRN